MPVMCNSPRAGFSSTGGYRGGSRDRPVRCTLPAGHPGAHEDSSGPRPVSWENTQYPDTCLGRKARASWWRQWRRKEKAPCP